MTSAPLLLLALALAPQTEVLSGVRVDVASAQDQRRLMNYVTLRAGDVPDAEELRRSVRYLFATGEFADVIVERRRTPAGLELVFRPVPAPRLSSIALEGDAPLSPATLRRVTHLRDGELLLAKRLERAAQDAALALAERGYLEARVSASAVASPSGGAAVFRVQAGPLTRIATLRITGLNAAATQVELGRLASQTGRAFSRKRAQDDARKLCQRLREAGRLAATVELRELYDPLQSRIVLVFEAETGPRTTLAFRGLAAAAHLQRQARRLLVEAGLRVDALDEVAELIEDRLRRKGYAFANVTYEQEHVDGERRVVFRAQTGPLVRVSAVRVEGAPNSDLARLVTTRPGQAYRELQVERDAQTLRRTLEEAGFASAQVDVDAPSETGATAVVFRVRPGAFGSVASVKVVAPIVVPGGAVENLDLKAGDAYSVSAAARARVALVTAYNNAGYPQANVSVETSPAAEADAVDIGFRVEPGDRAEIERILVAGLRHTREEVVRRELLFREGDHLRWDRVLESQRRLSSLGLFRGVSIYELDPDESRRRNLVVAVEEGPRTSLTGGIGAAGVSGDLSHTDDVNPVLRLSLEVARRNLGGLDRDLSLFSRLGFRGSRFQATYHEPYLLGHRADLAMTVFREDEERKTFNFDRVGASVQSTRTLRSRWNLIMRYVFSRTHSTAALSDDRQYQNELSSGPSFSLVNDTRDDPLDPRRGHFVSLDSQFSHALLGGHGFSKSFLQAAGFQPIGGPLLLAVGARVGTAWTFEGGRSTQAGDQSAGDDGRLDLPNRFYAGGNYSMRGFDTDAVAPTGGLALAVGSLELRCALGRSLSLAAFTDVGGIGSAFSADPQSGFPTAPHFSTHDVRASVGVGLRYRTPVGPIRFDWGFKLDPRPGEPRSRPHITVGHAF